MQQMLEKGVATVLPGATLPSLHTAQSRAPPSAALGAPPVVPTAATSSSAAIDAPPVVPPTTPPSVVQSAPVVPMPTMPPSAALGAPLVVPIATSSPPTTQLSATPVVQLQDETVNLVVSPPCSIQPPLQSVVNNMTDMGPIRRLPRRQAALNNRAVRVHENQQDTVEPNSTVNESNSGQSQFPTAREIASELMQQMLEKGVATVLPGATLPSLHTAHSRAPPSAALGAPPVVPTAATSSSAAIDAPPVVPPPTTPPSVVQSAPVVPMPTMPPSAALGAPLVVPIATSSPATQLSATPVVQLQDETVNLVVSPPCSIQPP
ncbi:proline-rich protein 36-like [Argopecten irradians]|uniref:proline-rich protein 36-like n=1 Tax=Argopecten irradians TaxID=31199 RepID=UPI00371BBBF0